MATRRVVVAGASGFVGGAAVKAFAAQGWQVTGLSRRAPAQATAGVDYRAVDLLDRDACDALARDLPDTSHLVFAAVNETPGGLVAGWSDPTHAARNGRMFDNLLRSIADAAPGLEHVTAVHGAKAYATHRVYQPEIPLRESLPRPDNDDFYFRQEDVLWALAAERGFAWTTFRPSMIAGGGEGSNLSGLLAIALYACLFKAAGEPAPFPGPAAAHGTNQMTDVRLLAGAIVWAATAPGARDRIFNITNGDLFCWADLWPRLCAAIGVAPGDTETGSVADRVRALAGRWTDLVAQHQLTVPADPFDYLGESFALADYTLAKAGRSMVLSTISLMQAGFCDCIDTADSVADWIGWWRGAGMLPPA